MGRTQVKKAERSKNVHLAKASRKKTLLLLSMVAPGAIWLLLLRYLPMTGIVMAFQKYGTQKRPKALLGLLDALEGMGLKSLADRLDGTVMFVNNLIKNEFVGFKNFNFLRPTGDFFKSDIWIMIRNTLGYNILFIILGLVLSVTFAILLNELTSKFSAKLYQTMMFFPYFLSWVVAAYFVQAFLDPTNGLLVHLLKNWGIMPPDFYNDTKPWPFILTLCNVWKNTGYSVILYLAAITGIDSSEYEAASIDGAGKWKQICYITLPHLKTMMIILFIMNVGRIFSSDFGLFFNVPLQSGPLIPVTQVVDTYVYRAMSSSATGYGMSTAAGLLQNLVGFVCIMTANTIVNKIDSDSALF